MNYSEIIKKKINSHKLNWATKPFPHAVIDDFLPKEIFEKIVSALNNSEDFKDVKKRFSSNVELFCKNDKSLMFHDFKTYGSF